MSSSWRDSTRAARLPKDWKKRRARILRRDPVCTTAGCTARSTEVDHIQRGDNHDDANLQGLCSPHHKAKTQREAHAAKPQRRRPEAPHPGRLNNGGNPR